MEIEQLARGFPSSLCFRRRNNNIQFVIANISEYDCTFIRILPPQGRTFLFLDLYPPVVEWLSEWASGQEELSARVFEISSKHCVKEEKSSVYPTISSTEIDLFVPTGKVDKTLTYIEQQLDQFDENTTIDEVSCCSTSSDCSTKWGFPKSCG